MKPPGHVAPITRYSARYDADVGGLAALFVGVQAADPAQVGAVHERWLAQVTAGGAAPVYFDRASYVDVAGVPNRIAALYWRDAPAFDAWCEREDVRAFRDLQRWIDCDAGLWWEPVVVPPQRSETIAFKEYLRGRSACPSSRMEPMEETGYWGAARDRIPDSGVDPLDGTVECLIDIGRQASQGRALSISPPKGLAIIRSGQSWEACGPEQLESYRKNLEPKLDAGMEYLRTHPVQAGCCFLRQLRCIDPDGSALDESYSAGAFVSLAHLERWSRSHPSHLAIYHKAMAERRKYQDKLELRTYNEIYIVDDLARPFDYFNCHPLTGLLPYFTARECTSI